MANRRASLAFGAVMVLLFWTCLVAASLAEEIKVGAGAAPTENILDKIKGPMEKAIGVKLTVISGGPSQAVKDLDKGLIDAAAGGLTFQDWMTMMTKEGYAIPDKAAYKYRVIGKDIIKVLTNKDTAVKNLSKEQLKGLFTGRTKNWKEIGGADKPVVVVLGAKIPGTQAVFQKQVMDGEPYTKTIQEGTDADDVKKKVAATSGAIGLGPMSGVDATVNAPEIMEIGRPITLITKGEPTGGVLKMLDYIRGEGQKYIVK